MFLFSTRLKVISHCLLCFGPLLLLFVLSLLSLSLSLSLSPFAGSLPFPVKVVEWSTKSQSVLSARHFLCRLLKRRSTAAVRCFLSILAANSLFPLSSFIHCFAATNTQLNSAQICLLSNLLEFCRFFVCLSVSLLLLLLLPLSSETTLHWFNLRLADSIFQF